MSKFEDIIGFDMDGTLVPQGADEVIPDKFPGSAELLRKQVQDRERRIFMASMTNRERLRHILEKNGFDVYVRPEDIYDLDIFVGSKSDAEIMDLWDIDGKRNSPVTRLKSYGPISKRELSVEGGKSCINHRQTAQRRLYVGNDINDVDFAFSAPDIPVILVPTPKNDIYWTQTGCIETLIDYFFEQDQMTWATFDDLFLNGHPELDASHVHTDWLVPLNLYADPIKESIRVVQLDLNYYFFSCMEYSDVKARIIRSVL